MNECLCDRIIVIMKSGRCQANVAKTVGFGQSTASRLFQRYISRRNASRSHVEGRPRKRKP